MRARIVAAVVLLFAPVALAGWYTTSVAGVPKDVQGVDAGDFVVTTGTGAALKHCDAGLPCVDVATLSGVSLASVDPSGCLFGANSAGNMSSGAGCTYTATLAGPMSPAFDRMRCFDTLCLATAAQGGVGGLNFTWAKPPLNTSWTTFTTGTARLSSVIVPLTPLGSIAFGGFDWVLVGGQGVRFGPVDGGTMLDVPGFASSQLTDIVVFPNRQGQIGALGTQRNPPLTIYGTNLSMTTYVDAGWVSVAIDPAVGALKQLTYTEALGSNAGFGFGMATQQDGGSLIASPVPDPSGSGRVWVPRSYVLPQPFVALNCFDPRFCVGVIADAGAPNVFVYWNEYPPVATVTGGATIVEGSTAQVAVSDLDGDPVFVTWGSASAPLTLTPDPDGGTSATVTAGANPNGLCTSFIPISVIASDGLAAHDTTTAFPDGGLVYQRVTPDPVGLTPSQASVDAGASVTLTATVGACSGKLTWVLTPDAGTLLVNGLMATYTAPLNFCSADAGVVVQVTGQIDAGLPITPVASTSIYVQPWGPPNTPTFDGGSFAQPAGTMQTYGFAGPAHVCPNAPPATVVLLDAGGMPPGVTVTVGLGGVVVSSADSCIGGTVAPSVAFEVAGVQSPPGGFTVTLVPDLQPLVSPADFSMNMQVNANEVHGVFTVDAGCLTERALTARVDVTGPTSSTTGLQPVPSMWMQPLIGGCNGGNYVVTATLFQDGGMIGSEVKMVGGQPAPAAVGELDQTQLTVSCDGVDAPLSLNPVAGACQYSGTAVTWVQWPDGGPALEPLASLPTVRVRTVAHQLDGLIGQTLTFDITSNAGMGNSATATRSVRLVPEHFVTVAHHTKPAAASSDDVVTVTADVVNNGTCRVTGVMLEETPTGLRFISGSARVDGAAVDASGAPSIGPFDLEAGQTRTITWLAKVPLLSTASVRGQAFIAGLPVSDVEPEPKKPEGCGCGSSPAALGVIGLAAFLRRRRRA